MFEMLGAFVSGFYQVLTPTTFGLMLIGIAVGFVVGILPGLGGPTTLALMLPFIFKMSAVEAFAFLLGMSAVTATTGDITSILFGVPGEPTTASTIVDGHPLAKGQALFYPAAFRPDARKVLEDNIASLIAVTEDEARRFACNAIVVEKNVVMNDGCSQTGERLYSLGFTVFETPLSEFIKAGGSAKCLVLKIAHDEG